MEIISKVSGALTSLGASVLIPIFIFIICMVFVIPIGGFSLIGIHDYSLLTFIRLYIRWRKSRRILVYRGIKWINTRKTTKKKSV